MNVAIVLSGLNALLLVGLLVFYGRIAVKSRAALSYGLVIFALFLLAQNLLTVFSYASMAPLFGDATVPYLCVMAALQLVALLALLRFTV